jgi:hypothetical protein
MLQYVPFALWLALLVYCLIDIDRAPPDAARRLPIPAWFAVVVLVPLLGALAWLLVGRPRGRPARVRAVAGSPPSVERPATQAPPDSRARAGADAGTSIDLRLRDELARIDREFDEAVRRRVNRARYEAPVATPRATPGAEPGGAGPDPRS